jgi:hypothetical protein
MVEATSSFDLEQVLLQDPCHDRMLKDSDCQRLANRPLPNDKLWLKNDLPDWKLLRDFLSREGPVSKPQCVKLLKATIEMFKKEPNLV